ncbi:sushi, nidogen and EGF-like domain-containing protein 1 isoform X1 [Haliotis rufescens]|uniref:sushi, nidogen and EGF-like domain-containing protein 1 isoform X1 n=1 Tax=Haliotis rufescens TaxID=6454 RepID=UPI00201F9928|nr:sushi, nidogen and EGF-like domain-containing protein 1 isoform X1 [Haliotis rufescens]
MEKNPITLLLFLLICHSCYSVVVNNDPCSWSPCQNRGVCTPQGTGYRCICWPGYSGVNCAVVNDDPCRLSPCQNRGTCTPQGTGYSCTCQPGFSDVNCTVCSTKMLDILFIEDVSFSIGKPRFDEMKRFQESMLNSTTISTSGDNVALMVFSSNASVVFKLNKYSNSKSDVLEALKQQTYEEGPITNISDAIKLASRQVFIPVNGDRMYVENMVVMFTDGYTTSEDREAIAASIGDLKAKAEVFVVAISAVDANSTVNVIASKPSNVFHIDDPNAASAIQKRMRFCLLS